MVAIAEMRDKLLTLDTVRERLALTEPLSELSFPLAGPNESIAHFDIQEGWFSEASHGVDVIPATVTIGGNEFALTKDALQEATSAIGLTKRYVEKTPAELIVPHLDYWFSNQPNRELKALTTDDTVLAFTKATISPFSNLRLLDETLAGIQEHYGTDDVLVDYKFHHSLRRTHMRLIVPDNVRAIRPDDEWSAGIDIRNSLSGEQGVGTQLQGYLFRWWCTNGATSTHSQSGTWNRRTGGQGDEVYEWARHAVDEILGGLEHEFEAVEELANTPIDGDVNDALADIFETYRVPLASREDIIEEMVNTDDLTMYGIMQAITRAANRDDISEPVREALMGIGGDIPQALTHRCENCHRLPIGH